MIYELTWLQQEQTVVVSSKQHFTDWSELIQQQKLPLCKQYRVVHRSFNTLKWSGVPKPSHMTAYARQVKNVVLQCVFILPREQKLLCYAPSQMDQLQDECAIELGFLSSEEEVVEEDGDSEDLLPQEFNCHCCYQVLVDPTTLNCGHNFCRHCLALWLVSSCKKECPECRQIWRGFPKVNVSFRYDSCRLASGS